MAELLTTGQERFAAAVAAATLLDIRTVRTWVLAEGGPDDNPLNIRHEGGFGGFGTVDAAVQRTVRLLRQGPAGFTTNPYEPILRTARDPRSTPAQELAAIAASPWEATNYTGSTGRTGGLLYPHYNRLYPRDRAVSSASTSAASLASTGDGTAQTVGFLDDAFKRGLETVVPGLKIWDLLPGDPAGKVAGWLFGGITGWLEEKAARAALYLLLTVAALWLLVMGLTRSMGTSPPAVAAGAAGRLPARRAADIPF